MVKDQVKLQQDPQPVKRFEVGDGNEFVIQVVVNDRKTTIEVTVEYGRQQVKKRESVKQFWSLEHADRSSQISIETVRVGIQHDAVRETCLHRTAMTS